MWWTEIFAHFLFGLQIVIRKRLLQSASLFPDFVLSHLSGPDFTLFLAISSSEIKIRWRTLAR